jgi:hypothetical protein
MSSRFRSELPFNSKPIISANYDPAWLSNYLQYTADYWSGSVFQGHKDMSVELIVREYKSGNNHKWTTRWSKTKQRHTTPHYVLVTTMRQQIQIA